MGYLLQGMQTGTVAGTLTVEGKSEPLRYIYAVAERDPDKPQKEAVRILLTNLPLPAKVTESMAAFFGHREDNKNRLWGILFELRPPEKRMAFLAIVHPVWGETMSPVLESEPQKLALSIYSREHLAGKLSMTDPAQFSFPPEGQTPDKKATYQFEAKFDVPIRRLALPHILTGEAARNAPPAQVIAPLLEAVRKGDSSGIRKYLSTDMRKRLDGPREKGMLPLFQKMATTMKVGQLSRVLIRGDKATIEFKPGKGETLSLEMVRENGLWKVGS